MKNLRLLHLVFVVAFLACLICPLVAQALPSTTVVTSTPVSPSVFGQPVSFTATVTAGATGTVQFYIDGAPFGVPAVVIANVATSGATTTLTVGAAHAVTANYSGDGTYTSSSGFLAGGQTVTPAATTTVVTSSANPSVWGQSVSFTATVIATAPGAGAPTGTVQFKDDGVDLGAPVTLNSISVANSIATTTLPVGTHVITAVYATDGNFAASVPIGTLTQVVNQAVTTMVVTSSGASVFGQSVTFTAVVSVATPGSGTPTGTVTFTIPGGGTPSVTLVGGSASTASATMAVGPAQVVSAIYGGATNFAAPVVAPTLLAGGQTVTKANTTTAVTSSVNPSVWGQLVTFKATVIAATPGAGTPTGSVEFFDGATSLGVSATVILAASTGVTTGALTVGNHTVTAVYTATGTDFNGSTGTLTGNPQVVNKAATSTAVLSSQNSSVYGTPVTFTATIGVVSPGVGVITPASIASVVFKSDGVIIGTASVGAGTAASTPIFTLTVGSHVITADYLGGTNFNTSSGTLNPAQTVTIVNTTTAVTSSLGTSLYGQPITFTATVTPTASPNVPTGTVQFRVDGVNVGAAVALTGGVASRVDTTMAAGARLITAVYSGDSNNATSTSPSIGQTVNKANTTTAVTSSTGGTSLYGQSVIFTAVVSVVSPGAGTPVGTVQFKIDGANFGTAVALTGGVATSGANTAMLVGTHTVTADYLVNSNFSISTGTLLGTQTVNQATTLTVVTSTPVSPSVFGQPVTFTATVNEVAPSGSGTLTGTVQFRVDGTNFGTAVALVSGVATSGANTALAVGSRVITAVYSGDSNNATSTGTLTQVVNQAATTTTVVSSVNPSEIGQSVTFTATVNANLPGIGTPTTPDTVQFKIDGFNFGLPVTLASGVAISTATTTPLSVGSHIVTAVYSGGTSFVTSTSTPLTLVVTKLITTTAMTSTPVSPSVFGRSVTFTATVTGSGSPTGNVQFNIDGAPFGAAVALVSGVASSTATTTLAVGNRVITAVYSGDSTFATSTSTPLTLVVNKHDTTTVVSSYLNLSLYGQPISFTATVSAAPESVIPTGTVQFVFDGANFGAPVALNSSGSAIIIPTPLAVGLHTITANYLGDGNFNASIGMLPIGQTVNQAATTTVVTSTPVSPSVSGQSVTFTATVNEVAPSGSGTLTGTVQFKIDGANFGTAVALTSGVATSRANTTMLVGSRAITAVYSGDVNNITSTSTPLTLVVNKANTATTVTSSVNPSVVSQPVTFTAVVSVATPGSGMPTGAVQFNIDGAPFGTAVALVSDSATSTAITTLTVVGSPHVVTATYSGDGSLNISTGTLTGGQTVNKAATATTVTSSVNPSAVSQSVTFTAVVSAVAPGSGVPTGTVQFKIDGANFGTAVALVSGSATSTAITTLTVVGSPHVVTATYSGDGSFNISTGTLTGGQTVVPEFNVINPTGTVNAGSPVAFRVDVAIPGTTVNLFYKLGGNSIYTQLTPPLSPSGTGNIIAWSGNIPAVDVTARGLVYYVDAVIGTTHYSTAPANILVRANSAFAFYTTPSGSPSVWNMISPNGFPDIDNLRSVVGPVFGGGGNWIAYDWDPSLGVNGNWRLLPDASNTFVPGRAWFFAKDGGGSGMPSSVPFSSISVNAASPFEITLPRGYSLVANPFAFPVAWNNATISILYNGTYYTPTAANTALIVGDKAIWLNPLTNTYIRRSSNELTPFTMMPNQGQWTFSNVVGAKMIIQPIYQIPTPIGTGTPPGAAPKNDMTSWEVTLSLQSSAGSDSITASVGKSTGNVELDQIKSPVMPLAPYIAFTREDQVGAASRLSSDVRSINDELTWSINATASSEMSLNWSLVNVPEDYTLSLDDQAGKVVNLSQDSAIHLGVGVHRFILKAEKKTLIPKATKLLTNYPNPFNPDTWIPYELSKDTDVAIKIYSSSGQLVRSLELGHKMAGFYSSKDKAAHWDGKNEAGEQVSSGIYFYNIQAGDYKDIRKMVIMK